MDTIRRRCSVLASGMACSGLLVLVVFLGHREVVRLPVRLWFIMAGGALAVLTALWLQEHRRLRTARLIELNPIISIRTATLSELDQEAKAVDLSDTVTIISYFGVLVGRNVVTFNRGPSQLRAVEIEPDHFSLIYGTERHRRRLRLLRPAIEAEALQQMGERLRYETGVRLKNSVTDP